MTRLAERNAPKGQDVLEVNQRERRQEEERKCPDNAEKEAALVFSGYVWHEGAGGLGSALGTATIITLTKAQAQSEYLQQFSLW